MNTAELLAVFREEVVDQALPYLWSDALIYTYINEAQKQFCRQTRGIEDSRQFTLDILVAEEWYAIDPQILKLRSAVNSADGTDVAIIAVEKMAANNMRFSGQVGPISALVTGMEKGYLRAYPTPNATATVELRTYRLPIDAEAGDDLEIDAQHVVPLLSWVKHKAYLKQDSETYDKNASDRHRVTWDAYCAAAKKEEDRKRPISTVAYGGY